MKMPLFALVALAALLLPAAHAAADVTVLLKVSAGTYLAPGEVCPVHVAAGSDGNVVLDAAVKAGCITSWSGTRYSFGTFLDCVDGLCGHNAGEAAAPLQDSDGTYWETSYGTHTASCALECYQATDLDVFGVTYQDWNAGFIDYEISMTLP